MSESTAWTVYVEHAWREKSDSVTLVTVPCTAREKTVKILRHELAFGCHTVIPREEARFTADSAVAQFVNANNDKIASLQAQIAKLRAQNDAAAKLTSECRAVPVEVADLARVTS